MNNNEDLRHALAREIVGDKRPLEEKNTGFKEVRDCLMSDETLSSEWETYKSTENGWATKTDVDKKAARDKFADDYKKKREEKLKKGKGFWTGIFGGIFSMYTIDDAKKDTLKL
jgi:hypothetical protein